MFLYVNWFIHGFTINLAYFVRTKQRSKQSRRRWETASGRRVGENSPSDAAAPSLFFLPITSWPFFFFFQHHTARLSTKPLCTRSTNDPVSSHTALVLRSSIRYIWIPANRNDKPQIPPALTFTPQVSGHCEIISIYTHFPADSHNQENWRTAIARPLSTHTHIHRNTQTHTQW